MWFPNVINWARRWGTPILGTYNSTDADVIDKHAEWFTSLGVDFLIVDWSNSSQNFVAGNVAVDTHTRANTDALFAEYARLEQQGKPHPQIVILLGAQDEGGVRQSQVIASGALQDEAITSTILRRALSLDLFCARSKAAAAGLRRLQWRSGVARFPFQRAHHVGHIGIASRYLLKSVLEHHLELV